MDFQVQRRSRRVATLEKPWDLDAFALRVQAVMIAGRGGID